MRKPKALTAGLSGGNRGRKRAHGSVMSQKQAIQLATVSKLKLVPAYPLRISNVVCTAWCGKNVSRRLVQLACQGRLDADLFPSTVSVSWNPATTNSIFETGRLLIAGAPSVSMALYSAMVYIDKVNRVLHEDLSIHNFTVQNMVSSFSLGYMLDIYRFFVEQKATPHGHAHYDPSRFRGCSWRVRNGLVFVLFVSGKVVLTGARCWEDANEAYQWAQTILENYKLDIEQGESVPRSSKRRREHSE